MADSSVLRISKLSYEESELFQKKTKEWMHEVLLSATNTNFCNNSVDEKGDMGNEVAKKQVVVKYFTVDILAESDGRLFPRQHPILKFQLQSQIEGSVIESTDHIIVKILDDSQPANNVTDNFGIREYNFYTLVVPHLLLWAKSRSHKIQLGIPKCYYGKYFNEGDGENADEFEGDMSEDKDSVTLMLDNMSTLVLENLSANGFLHCTNAFSLSREEVRAALRELAIFHSLSWAYSHITKDDLIKRFNFCEDIEDFVNGQVKVITESFPKLFTYLSEEVSDGKNLLVYLDRVMTSLRSLLSDMFIEPKVADGPLCLLHMDFWTQNLFFHDTHQVHGILGGTTCRIIDWQNVIPGSPTHDIACLLYMSISAPFRVVATSSLLEYYWNVFKENCFNLKVDIPYDFQCLQLQYKKSRILPLLMMMGSVGIELENPVATAKFLEIVRENICMNSR